MDECTLNTFEIEGGLTIGNINLDDEINKRAIEYLNTIKSFIENKKLKSCEYFINSILNDFKNNPFEHIMYISIKIYCNLRLHNYRAASTDLNIVGNLDNDNYKFESYQFKYKKKTGSMVPFLLRLINCYYPYTLNLYFTSFDRLYLMILHYENILKNCIEKIETCENEKDVFLRRKNVVFHYIITICYVLCDLLLKKNHIDQAIQLLKDKILRYDPNHINTISLHGKLFLLLGCFDTAEYSFNLASLLSKGNNDNHIKMNANFLNLFLDNYEIALHEILRIDSIINKHNNNIVNDYSIYCNNLTITYFYNADLKKSIQTLENAVTDNPLTSFPSLVKNINYLYELSKTQNETVNQINDLIKNNLNEDQEVLSLIPNKS